MDYQAYAYLQMVKDRAARDVIARLPAAAAQFDLPRSRRRGARVAGYFALAAIPARFALERGAWEDAARLEVPANGDAVHDRDHAFRASAGRRAQRPPRGGEQRSRAPGRAARSVDAGAGRLLGGASRHPATHRRRMGRVCRRAARRSARHCARRPMRRMRPISRPSRPGRSRPRASFWARCCSTLGMRRAHSQRSRHRWRRSPDDSAARSARHGQPRPPAMLLKRVSITREPPRSRATPIRRAPSSSGRGATSRLCSSRSADARLSRTRDAA